MIPRRYAKLKQVLDLRQPDLTVLTENVHKAHNISAIIRTCDAVGVFALHAVNNHSTLPIYSQVTQGSEKWVKLHTHFNIQAGIEYLQQQNHRVYAAHLSDTAMDYRQVDYTKPTAILLGTEKWGVSKEAANLVDGHIIIPMQGMVQSLNVSVANAIILYEAQRQRLAAGMYQRVRLDPQTYNTVLFEWSYPEVAAIYRRQGKPYPQLGQEGELLLN
ncbi:putative tRNA (guanosine-2'-O-)-methyltransferase [Chondrocystis sp. NIES-4102]|nr:putative tRNA (guanosine-2'-O-)-methyltransferase [Chondrocystis sp. NIES-4102]